MKFRVGIGIVLIIAIIGTCIVSCQMDQNDPIRKDEEQFGTVWYGTTDASVRVKRMDVQEELYRVTLCWYDLDGTVRDYENMDICSKERLGEAVDTAVKYYYNVRE